MYIGISSGVPSIFVENPCFFGSHLLCFFGRFAHMAGRMSDVIFIGVSLAFGSWLKRHHEHTGSIVLLGLKYTDSCCDNQQEKVSSFTP